MIEAYNSSSYEPVIAFESLIQQDACRKPYECGTIRDNSANYGHDPDLLVLRLVGALADGSLDFGEFLNCKLASIYFSGLDVRTKGLSQSAIGHHAIRCCLQESSTRALACRIC